MTLQIWFFSILRCNWIVKTFLGILEYTVFTVRELVYFPFPVVYLSPMRRDTVQNNFIVNHSGEISITNGGTNE